MSAAEIPTHRDAPKAVSAAAIQTLANVMATAEDAGAPSLRGVADQVIRKMAADWSAKATAEITTAVDAAIAKALRDWKPKQRDLQLQVARAIAATHAQGDMDAWAAAAITQIDAELDERNLISTDVLAAITFTRPPRKGEDKAVLTDGVDCLDDEFMTWYVRQLSENKNGEGGLDAANRIAFRLLLVAALDWIRGERQHWREPRLLEGTQ